MINLRNSKIFVFLCRNSISDNFSEFEIFCFIFFHCAYFLEFEEEEN